MSEGEIKRNMSEIITLLKQAYPNAGTALKFTNPLELLVSTILSAQCTDTRVNIVTEKLFRKYKVADDYAKADLKELEQEIRSTGFYRNKAKNIKKCCQILVEKYNSQVPKRMRELVELPGVARKTANIVLANAYNVIEGIAVDTHVRRLSKRLGLTLNDQPEKIERDLMRLIPKTYWKLISNLLILHGRQVCNARRPDCAKCVLKNLCVSAFKISSTNSKSHVP